MGWIGFVIQAAWHLWLGVRTEGPLERNRRSGGNVSGRVAVRQVGGSARVGAGYVLQHLHYPCCHEQARSALSDWCVHRAASNHKEHAIAGQSKAG